MRTFSRQLTFAIALAALGVAGQRQSHAQTTEAAPSNQNSTLTEVVVTAERRTENVMDVPMSVQAFSPELLDQLEQTEGVVDRELDPKHAKASLGDRLHLDEKTFRWMHNEDAMATEKLAEGIRKFNADARRLQEFALSQVTAKVA